MAYFQCKNMYKLGGMTGGIFNRWKATLQCMHSRSDSYNRIQYSNLIHGTLNMVYGILKKNIIIVRVIGWMSLKNFKIETMSLPSLFLSSSLISSSSPSPVDDAHRRGEGAAAAAELAAVAAVAAMAALRRVLIFLKVITRNIVIPSNDS